MVTTCNVCPVVIPEIFAQTQGSDYQKLIDYWKRVKIGKPQENLIQT